MKENENNNLERGDVVVATWGYNDVLNEPFKFLYEFGYYTKYGCVVYNQGESNMQDSHAFKLNEIRLATDEDKRNQFW
jgi:hypothetical protein